MQLESTDNTHLMGWLKIYLFVAVVSGLGIAGKSRLLHSVTHLPPIFAVPAALLLPCLPLLWQIAWKKRRLVGVLVPVLLIGVLMTIVRTGALHKLGRGSDQGDCVIVASQRMMHGKWPYRAADMPTHNAMSCGPGWIAVQAPLILVAGYAGDQIVIWIAALALMFVVLGLDRTRGFLALLGVCAGTWISVADGNDFLFFGLALTSVYVYLCDDRKHTSAKVTLCAVALCLLAQFRVPMVFLPLLFIKRLGFVRALTAFAVALTTELAFLAWNSSSFVLEGPMHVAAKLFRTHTGFKLSFALAELLIPTLLGAAAIIYVCSRKYDVTKLVMIYIGVLVLIPALQNFLLLYRVNGDVLNSLQFWEGGNWVVALLPLAAVPVVLALQPTSSALAPATQNEVGSRTPA